MDHTEKSPVILSLCTGMRGIERGIERIIGPLAVAAYVEIEAFIIYNLVRQMEQGLVDPAPVWADIKTLPAGQFYGKVHGIIGGYPCQPFSLAGERGGTEDPRHLWPFIKRDIAIIQPVWCLFENVLGHLSLGYREVRYDLEALGYTVKEGIYSAQEVGAPHERKRLFILAVKLGNTAGSEQETGRGNNAEVLDLSQKQWTEFSTTLFGRTGFELGDTGHKQLEKSNGPKSERSEQTSSELADTYSKRRKKSFCEQQPCVSKKIEPYKGREFSRNFTAQWPLPQGPYQHEWEQPRTVKSGVGCSIDGYNFRTDLLRMYGNGVVEQTAALAFADLLMKHFEEFQAVYDLI